MLEVQLCRRSRLGAVIPIARSDSDDLVRLVAAYMRAKLETIQLADPLLAEFVADERKRLQQHLLAEGIDCIPEVAIHSTQKGDSFMDVLRVSATSPARALAGCIAGVIREQSHAELQAIGAAAVNQAIKAVAIAREFLVHDGLDIVLIPSFTQVMIGDQEKSAIRFVVEVRPGGQ